MAYQGNPPYQGGSGEPYQGRHGDRSGPYDGGPGGPYEGGSGGPYQGGPPGRSYQDGPGAGPYQGGPGPYQGAPGGPYQGAPAGPYQGGPYQGGPGGPYQGGPGPYQGGPYQGGPGPYQGGPYQGAPYQGGPYQGGPGYAGVNSAMYSDWIHRVGAMLIDYAPIWLIFYLFSLAHNGILDLLVLLAGLGVSIWNRWILGGQGQSLGKRVLGVRLLSEETGQPIGTLNAFVRDMCHFVDAIICGVGYLFPLWEAKRQTLADKIMHTVVVPA